MGSSVINPSVSYQHHCVFVVAVRSILSLSFTLHHTLLLLSLLVHLICLSSTYVLCLYHHLILCLPLLN